MYDSNSHEYNHRNYWRERRNGESYRGTQSERLYKRTSDESYSRAGEEQQYKRAVDDRFSYAMTGSKETESIYGTPRRFRNNRIREYTRDEGRPGVRRASLSVTVSSYPRHRGDVRAKNDYSWDGGRDPHNSWLEGGRRQNSWPEEGVRNVDLPQDSYLHNKDFIPTEEERHRRKSLTYRKRNEYSKFLDEYAYEDRNDMRRHSDVSPIDIKTFAESQFYNDYKNYEHSGRHYDAQYRDDGSRRRSSSFGNKSYIQDESPSRNCEWDHTRDKRSYRTYDDYQNYESDPYCRTNSYKAKSYYNPKESRHKDTYRYRNRKSIVDTKLPTYKDRKVSARNDIILSSGVKLKYNSSDNKYHAVLENPDVEAPIRINKYHSTADDIDTGFVHSPSKYQEIPENPVDRFQQPDHAHHATSRPQETVYPYPPDKHLEESQLQDPGYSHWRENRKKSRETNKLAVEESPNAQPITLSPNSSRKHMRRKSFYDTTGVYERPANSFIEVRQNSTIDGHLLNVESAVQEQNVIKLVTKTPEIEIIEPDQKVTRPVSDGIISKTKLETENVSPQVPSSSESEDKELDDVRIVPGQEDCSIIPELSTVKLIAHQTLDNFISKTCESPKHLMKKKQESITETLKTDGTIYSVRKIRHMDLSSNTSDESESEGENKENNKQSDNTVVEPDLIVPEEDGTNFNRTLQRLPSPNFDELNLNFSPLSGNSPGPTIVILPEIEDVSTSLGLTKLKDMTSNWLSTARLVH